MKQNVIKNHPYIAPHFKISAGTPRTVIAEKNFVPESFIEPMKNGLSYGLSKWAVIWTDLTWKKSQEIMQGVSLQLILKPSCILPLRLVHLPVVWSGSKPEIDQNSSDIDRKWTESESYFFDWYINQRPTIIGTALKGSQFLARLLINSQSENSLWEPT